MARITIDSIKQEIEPLKWKIISEEYVNLDTPILFECPEGHKVEIPWTKLRGKVECPVCAQN